MKIYCETKIGNIVPRKFNEFDIGHDVYLVEDVMLYAGKTVRISLELKLDVPRGVLCEIRPRSSTMERGLIIQSAPIDPGYEGEVSIVVSNFTGGYVRLKKDERIGQLIFSQAIEVELVGKKLINNRGAGGFGSTNKS
jgi:dUTP pyrophosphatase